MPDKESGRVDPSRKRIAIDVTSAFAQKAGIGRYTRELVGALVKQDNSSDYLLFSARQSSQSLADSRMPSGSHIHYHQAPLTERWLYRLWYRLNVPLPVQRFTGEFDLFYSPDFVLPPVRGGLPTVLTVHDLSFLHYPETFTPALIRYLNQAVPRSIRRASQILADSQATKHDLIAKWGVEENKITVLYSGVDKVFRPRTARHELLAMREKYGLGDEPYLLSVSTIQPRKNYALLIRAFRDIARLHPHNLVIAGSLGWMHEEILQEAHKQGLEDRVRFIGFVVDEDLPALYSDASLFLFPSLYEGFGLPIIEAMACGVPAIVSDSSSLPEIAGEAAMVLPAKDQNAWSRGIQELLIDSTRCMKMVAAGFLRARQFSWKRAAGQLADLFDDLLSDFR